MPHLSENERPHAVGVLDTGMPQNVVAMCLGVHRNTIQSLSISYQQTGNIRDRPRSGRPCVMSRRQGNHIRLVYLNNWFQAASLIARSIPGL